MSRAEYLRPSSAATWVLCGGNVAMRAAFPSAPDEADNEVCEDGTACHWLAAEIYEGRMPAEGSLAPNGRVITEEMFEAVDMYHEEIFSWTNVVPVVEQPVDCSVIYEGMRGTPDVWAYNPDKRRLYIADLKFGFRFVEVWENWQLIIYAAAILELLFPDRADYDDQTITIEFAIVQPRSFHRAGPVRKWCVKASDLRAYVTILKHAAHVAMQDNPMCTPNPGCGDCPGRHACMTYQHAAYTALEQSYDSVPLELSPAALGKELTVLKTALKRIEGRISGLEVQAESQLRNGKSIPGWILAPTFARETWQEGKDADVLTLEKYFPGVTLRKPAKAITPAQARKVIPKDVVSLYAHKPSTGVRLTKQDPLEAKKAFSQ